jgi:hypothetical protein
MLHLVDFFYIDSKYNKICKFVKKKCIQLLNFPVEGILNYIAQGSLVIGSAHKNGHNQLETLKATPLTNTPYRPKLS